MSIISNIDLDNIEDSHVLFTKSKPTNIISGILSCVGNISLGVISGVIGVISIPIIHFYKYGSKGIFSGIGIGLLLFILLPIGGLVMGATSIVKGIYETPQIIYNYKLGKIWDPFQKQWVFYSLEKEKQ